MIPATARGIILRQSGVAFISRVGRFLPVSPLVGVAVPKVAEVGG